MENPDDGTERHHMENPDYGTERHITWKIQMMAQKEKWQWYITPIAERKTTMVHHAHC
jgi:hypothetical protein